MELGIYTFAELTADPRTGRAVTPSQRLRDLIEEIELSDHASMMNRIGRERGWPLTRTDYDALRTRRGALVVGSPQVVRAELARRATAA